MRVCCIASSTAIQHDFSYSRLYSTEALGAAHGGTDTTVNMVTWEPGWVRVTPHTSHMARVTQKTIGKRQTSISGALWLPSVAASMAILYSPLCSNTPQKAAVLGNTAHGVWCWSIAIQRSTFYSSTAFYTLQRSTTPLSFAGVK